MELERVPVKWFEVKAPNASLQENRIRVVPSVMGVMDSYGDVIFPKAFAKVGKAFLSGGFVSDSHDWSMEGMIAMPLSLQEQGRELVSEAEFHSTADAQTIRTKCVERLARGLSVGASIGFYTSSEGRAYFDDGKALLKYAEEQGADMSLFDVKGIKAWDHWCRAITAIEELYEYAICPVGVNRAAGVMDAKAGGIGTEREFEAFLRDAGYSRAQAVAITSHGFKAVRDQADPQRDADEAKAAALQEAARQAHARFLATITGV